MFFSLKTCKVLYSTSVLFNFFVKSIFAKISSFENNHLAWYFLTIINSSGKIDFFRSIRAAFQIVTSRCKYYRMVRWSHLEWEDVSIKTTSEKKSSEIYHYNHLFFRFVDNFYVSKIFIATRSGLTRWRTYTKNEDEDETNDFEMLYPNSIDEEWYRRAVEENYNSEDTFIYSVPFEISGT